MSVVETNLDENHEISTPAGYKKVFYREERCVFKESQANSQLNFFL